MKKNNVNKKPAKKSMEEINELDSSDLNNYTSNV